MDASPVAAAAPAEAPKGSPVDALFDKSKPAPEATPNAKAEPKEDSASKQMALIAREQKRLAAEREQFKAEREAQKATLSEFEQLKALQAEIKADPLGALKKFGMDYSKLIAAELQRQEEESNPTMRKVRELEHKIAEKERVEAETAVKLAEQSQQHLIDEHVGRIRTHIAANPEKYEFLNTYKAEQDVFNKIKEVFDASVKRDASGRIASFKELTIDEACSLVEADYEESATALTKLKKIQNKLNPPKEEVRIKSETKSETKSSAPAEKPKTATLNNTLADPSSGRQKTRAERAARAFELLHGGH